MSSNKISWHEAIQMVAEGKRVKVRFKDGADWKTVLKDGYLTVEQIVDAEFILHSECRSFTGALNWLALGKRISRMPWDKDCYLIKHGQHVISCAGGPPCLTITDYMSLDWYCIDE